MDVKNIKIRVGDKVKSDASTCSMDQVRAFVRQIKEKEDEIKAVRDDIKALTDDFVTTYGLPKKEVKVAIRMLKGDIDPDVVSEIYTNIADLVE